jgi:ATP-binding cassette subfamily C (CFTR/MRP) protein 1
MLSTYLLTDRKAFNLVLLVFQSSIVGLSLSVPTKLSDALAETAHLVAVVGLVILSPREHYRSMSPSKSLVVYLSTRTFLNASALLLGYNRGFMTIQALRIVIEAGNLIVESQNKKHFLLEPFLDIAPEETAGPWSKASFAWVSSILFAGKDIEFALETLPQNPRRFDPSDLRQNILLAWDQRGKPTSYIQRINLTKSYS